MRKLICALIGAAALVASATTYIQTSPTGTAPWKPVKDSVSQAHLADSALHAPPSAYADISRVSGLADSAKRAGWAPLDTGRVRGIVSDTAATLRTGISSAITTSEAYATARISDSLTANARAWTTLTAAKSSVHDTATALRTYIGSASTTGNAATATKLATARTIATSGDVTGTPTAFDGTANITIPTAFANTHLAGINQDLTTTSSPTFAGIITTIAYGTCGVFTGNADNAAYSAYNLKIKSWWGIGFESYDNVTRIIFDTRTGNISTLGSISENGTALSSKYLGINTSIPHTQVSDWATATSSFLTANQSISLTGAITGSGTTSIATSFANMHLAGINQDLTTTSSPTFTSATIANGIYRAYANDATVGAIYGSGVAPSATNYALAWDQNGNGAYLNGTTSSNLSINNSNVLTATSTGVSVTGALNVSGLITANGGISGNLTGHASLDIPLTGSSAITGALTSSNSSNIGSTSFNWGTVYATSVRSTGTESISSFALSGDVLTLSHSNGDLTWVNTIRGSAAGLVLQNAIISGTFSPEVNRQSSIYIITRADQGKMVISNNTLNLPSLTEHDAGFWCLVNWHVGGGTATFGPTTSGTSWNLRGQSTDVSTSMPFTGIVSWDGYNWYAN